MCNLYKMKRTTAEVADLFRAPVGQVGNAGGEVYPGYPGIVVAAGEVRQMTWGFPLVVTGKGGQPLKPRPVNNSRSDKLERSFWRASFYTRRCLIPVEAFAEAEGPTGGKTRTWFTVPEQPLFAVAGIWRDTDEWGPAYSMVMTDANAIVSTVHDRMPLILEPAQWATWVDGVPDEALAMAVPYEGALAVERTTDAWVKQKQGVAS